MLLVVVYSSLVSSDSEDFFTHLRRTKMNERAERINGWAAMLGIIAAMGAYITTGQLIPGVL